jgi:hypothetical protein
MTLQPPRPPARHASLELSFEFYERASVGAADSLIRAYVTEWGGGNGWGVGGGEGNVGNSIDTKYSKY